MATERADNRQVDYMVPCFNNDINQARKCRQFIKNLNMSNRITFPQQCVILHNHIHKTIFKICQSQ